MLRFGLFSLAPLAVLVFGLASCGGDHHDAAPPAAARMRATPPVILRNGGPIDLPAWDHGEERTLNLSEKIDVSAAHAPIVSVTSHCELENKEVSHHVWFENESQLEIARLVPPQMLTRDLSAAGRPCRFEVQMSDGTGIRHGYALYAVIKDEGASAVRVDGAMDVRMDHAVGRKVRFDNARPSWARLVCADVTLPAVPFNKVFDLSEFDLQDPRLAELKPQFCRVVIVEPDAARPADAETSPRRAVSNLLRLHTQRHPWLIKARELSVIHDQYNGDNKRFTSIAEYDVTNLDDMPKRLTTREFGPGNVQPKVEITVVSDDGKNFQTMNADLSEIAYVEPGVMMPLNGRKVSVGANETIHLKALFSVYNEYLNCAHSAVAFRLSKPLYIEELGTNDQVVSSLELPPAKPVWSKPQLDYEFDLAKMSEKQFCEWIRPED